MGQVGREDRSAKWHLTPTGRKREIRDLMRQSQAGGGRKSPKVLEQAVLHSSWKNKRRAIRQSEPSSQQHSGGAEV